MRPVIIIGLLLVGCLLVACLLVAFLLVAGLWPMIFQQLTPLVQSPTPQATPLVQNPTPQATPLAQKAGLWEIELMVEIPNVPLGGVTNRLRHCVEEDDAKQGLVFADIYRSDDISGIPPGAGECRIENLRYSERGHVTYDIVCGQQGVRITVEYRYTETTFEGTIYTVRGGPRLTYKIKGRYVGPC